MSIVVNNTPQTIPQIVNVGTAVTQFADFNAIYNASYSYLESIGLNTPDLAQWRKDYREGIINTAGTPPDIDFFRKLAGSTTMEIDATDYTIESRDAIDFNIYADAAASGVAAGTITNAYYEQCQNSTLTGINYAIFKPIAGTYQVSGTENKITLGMGLFIPEDGEEVIVVKIDKSVAYSWDVWVVPKNETYLPNIYAKTAMFVRPTTQTTGYASSASVVAKTPWSTVGFFDRVQAEQFSDAWETPMDLDQGFRDVLQFPILFDNVTGQSIETFAFKAQLEMMNDMKMSATFAMFLGQKKVNTVLSAFDYAQGKYNGFDGLMPKMWYAGGNTRFWNNTYGFAIDSDLMNMWFDNDSVKKSKELLFLNSLNFQNQFERVNNEYIKNFPGSCTFQTFSRSGETDITKMGIQSFMWNGFSVHLRQVGSFNDSRFYGNAWVRDLAIVMPGEAMPDSNGNLVNPFEFYRQRGQSMANEWQVTMTDGRTTAERSTKWFGTGQFRLMMAINGIRNMYAIMPDYVL